jgi:Ni/Co efflux regulator RcnB
MPSIHTNGSPSHAELATSGFSRKLLILLSALMLCGAALAQRPDGAGGGRHDGGDRDHRDYRDQRNNRGKGGNGGKGDKHSQGPDRQSSVRIEIQAGGYFQDRQRSAVRDYYGTQYRAGRCPPGLSKKQNGCMPPGQARYYSVGQRLAPSVTYHNVPSAIVVTLGVPPSGHRYVRVAADILLIAVGTGMVVDAIQDLGGL